MTRADLACLICGDFRNHKSIESIYEVLFNKLSNYESRIDKLLRDDNVDDLTVLGPYLARTVLETTCTAIIGRLDPFRIISLRNVQSLSNFSLGNKSTSAISWSGDVFGKNETTTNLWSPDKDISKIERVLLGRYYGEMYWNPSYKKMLDDNTISNEMALEYYRTVVEDPERFILYLRSESSRIYSSLSKGVHSELVIAEEVVYDKTTVSVLISDTIKLCSVLGYLSHYIDTVICRLPIDNALASFNSIDIWREELSE
ncbi:hypothetical protein [Paenibacillus sp. NRS-1760]|uniref:hypothetical protein n=1 Tax=Paenibacillus sp. NRS-1760 TaxID=3233902 RepID=UPI003D2DD4EE